MVFIVPFGEWEQNPRLQAVENSLFADIICGTGRPADNAPLFLLAAMIRRDNFYRNKRFN